MSLSLHFYPASDTGQLKVTGLTMTLFHISPLLLLLLVLALSLPGTRGDEWWNEELPQLKTDETDLGKVNGNYLSDV